MSSKPLVLVTSAAGHTGIPTVTELLAHGFPVRALVRREDHRSRRMSQAGAQVMVGDLFDIRDLRRALHGVQRAYYCPPFAPNLLHGSALFAVAAEEARLETVTVMNAWNPHPTHPSMVQRELWLAGKIQDWMPDVDVVHLQPGLFAFTYFFSLVAARHLGVLMLPFGEGLNAPPSNEDLGRVAAQTLMTPEPHVGKHYRPTGPALISGFDCAGIFTRILGRTVAYRDVSTRMFVKAALALGMSMFEVAQIRHYAEELRGGTYALGAPTGDVLSICGAAAEDFETTARRYIADPERVMPGMSTSNRTSALALMLRTILRAAPDLDRWERERDHPLLCDAELAHQSSEWRRSIAAPCPARPAVQQAAGPD